MQPPQLSFILSTNGAPGELEVQENGQPVDYSLTTIGEAKGRFGLVLAVDSSLSLKGQEGLALSATRDFVVRRPEQQSIGVVYFNSQVRTVVPLTQDDGRLREALNEPLALASGTRIYDALSTAAQMLAAAKVDGGSIVLLSDGQDSGSTVSRSQALALVDKHHLQVFSVGLRSSGFEPETLRELAAASGGLYSEVDSAADLGGVYDAINARLTSEYLLIYKSQVEPGRSLRLDVSDGSTRTSINYVVPLSSVATDASDAADNPLLRWAATLVPALFVFVLLFLFLLPRPSTPAAPSEEEDLVGLDRAQIAAYLPKQGQNSLTRSRWWRSLERDLDLARIELGRRDWTGYAVLALVFAGLLALLNPAFAVLVLVLPLLGRVVLRRKVRQRRRLFAAQFPDTLQIVASALRAGYGLSKAVQMVVDDCPEPTRAEYLRVLHDERLGVPLDRALRRAAERMESRDLEHAAMAAQLQQQTGGNTAEIFDRVIETVRVRVELQRRVESLTAQGRLARWIVSIMPLGIAGLILVLNPGYLRPLVETGLGMFMLVASVVMLLAGNLLIKRIVEIEA